MSRHSITPPCSPSRKRQRIEFSSPIIPEEELTEAQLGELDEIEQRLSQSMSQQGSSHSAKNFTQSSDSDNPFAGPSRSPPAPQFVGFKTASTISHSHQQSSQDWNRSSPEPPQEKEYDSWFHPAPAMDFGGFQTAAFASASSLPAKKDEPSFGFGFKTGGGKGILAPSSAALAKAREKMKEWQEDGEDDAEPSVLLPTPATFRTASSISSETSQRPPLRPVENSVIDTPCPPSGFSRASATFSSPAFQSPLIDPAKRNRPKPFKTPLLTTPNAKASSPIPFKPPSQIQNQTPSSFVSARSQHPLSAAPVSAAFETPVRPRAIASIPTSASTTPARKSTPARFVTPFKPGMKPGQPGRKALETPSASTPAAKKKVVSVFNLTPSPSRETLASSGLVPQAYSANDLSDMGISIDDLTQLTPKNAIFYSFYHYTPSSGLSLAQEEHLGPKDALNHLLTAQATLATKPWVDNHWSLILWKLAGMVLLDPERERTPRPRWSWDEAYKQLLYRYERELNGGVRPPLRRIVNQDTPASCPMVLCVSDITWSERRQLPDGTYIDPHPELEMTDGWYRLRAEIDIPLARAVRRGLIKVGRKLAIVGARLDSERKDPMEILEAYNSVKLVLSGNSSHLAPWHAKLGFTKSFGVVTMHSLTADGGLVPLMDLAVLKVYPIAYLEIKVDEEGNRTQEGPRTEVDEARCADKWKQTREIEESKLRLEHEKKVTRYLGYAERLEHRCNGRIFTEDSPDNIESLYDELEEPDDAGQTISRTNANTAGWLGRYIREKLEKDGERVRDEIEKELDSICPPRNIRSFRVVLVQDARTDRRPANRTAQLTIWDVLNVQLTENRSPGYFEIGDRVVVTNLMPSQKSAWMKNEPGSEIFLVSSKNSRWQKVSASA